MCHSEPIVWYPDVSSMPTLNFAGQGDAVALEAPEFTWAPIMAPRMARV